MSKQVPKSEYDFLLYRIDVLEKRIDAMDKSSTSELVSILLNLLEKKEVHVPLVEVVQQQEQPKCNGTKEAAYDALLSFARRRTIV